MVGRFLILIVLGIASGVTPPGKVSATVTATQHAERHTFPAILFAGKTALIKSEHDATVTAAALTPGSAVTRGQLLVELESAEERLNRDRAAALLEQARTFCERVGRLHAQGLATDEALEDAQTELKLARADYELAQLRLAERTVRAPFDGVVAERFVDPGTSVESGEPLIRLTACDPLRVEALLPEQMLATLRSGAHVTLTPTYPETTLTFMMQLSTIVVDPASGTFPLQIEVGNAAGRLIPGVSCQVTISPVGTDLHGEIHDLQTAR